MKRKTKVRILKFLYWLDACTWGLPLTIVGLLITGVCLLLGGKAYKNGFTYIVEIGGNWGGLECGPVALCGRYSKKDGPCYDPSWAEKTHNHEFGHSLQFMYMGIFFLFIVGLPSACRYWYQRIAQKHGKIFPSDWYDSIWFEGGATKGGTKVNNWISEK